MVLTVEVVMETTMLLSPSFLVVLSLVLFILIGLVIYLMVEVSKLKEKSIPQIHISELPMGWYHIAFYYDHDKVSVVSYTFRNKKRIFVIHHSGLLPEGKCEVGDAFFVSKNDKGDTCVIIKGESRTLDNPQQPVPSPSTA